MSEAEQAGIGISAKSVGRQLRELAEPIERDEKIDVIVARAARRCGIEYWRAFNIWYGKARRIEQYEYDAIAAALDKKRKEAARNELHELKTRIARLESLLAQTDPDFHRETLAALGDQRRQLDRGAGAVRRPMAARPRPA